MKNIIVLYLVCFWFSSQAQNQIIVPHRISVYYKDGTATGWGNILRVDDHSIEFRLKPKNKRDSVKIIRVDSSEAHLIKFIIVSRKKVKGSTVFLMTVAGGLTGYYIGYSLGQGGDTDPSFIGAIFAFPGILIGTFFGIIAGFETKTLQVKGDVAAFDKALLLIRERLYKLSKKMRTGKSK